LSVAVVRLKQASVGLVELEQQPTIGTVSAAHRDNRVLHRIQHDAQEIGGYERGSRVDDQVEATASFAARWMLTPAARVGALDIVVQREDPERDPAVFVETRFSFGGSWRFTERELARADKAARQVGKWAGSLD
jgi:hypothetical protein